jgi:hypothetical protein
MGASSDIIILMRYFFKPKNQFPKEIECQPYKAEHEGFCIQNLSWCDVPTNNFSKSK